MNLVDEFKCYVGAYYGIESMDNYELKEYILKDIENYIKDFVNSNKLDGFNYKECALKVKDEVSLNNKLHDSLLLLNKINAPMDLILLVKRKIKKI